MVITCECISANQSAILFSEIIELLYFHVNLGKFGEKIRSTKNIVQVSGIVMCKIRHCDRPNFAN